MAMWRLWGLMLMLFSVVVRAGVTVVDDTGATITLAQPAQRIVSLAPHTTELLFAVGAGKQIVGAVDYSDYPEAAKLIPRVGGYSGFDLERVVMLKPDLVVAWRSGNTNAAVEKLQQLGLKVYLSEPRALDDVATNLERLGTLAGHATAGRQAAADYRNELKQLQQRYAGATKVRLFYQIWNSPLMTINGQHLIGRVIDLCGGQNIFASLPTLAPQVDLEAVLLANPEAIIASGMGYDRPEWLDEWQRWPELAAVKSGTIFVIHPDIINRHSPRILKGAAQMCDQLQAVRARRK